MVGKDLALIGRRVTRLSATLPLCGVSVSFGGCFSQMMNFRPVWAVMSVVTIGTTNSTRVIGPKLIILP